MSAYAKGTYVTVETSRAELDCLLQKHGATSRLVGQDDEENRAVVGFSLGGAKYRLNIPLPETPSNASPRRVRDALQAHKERWRLVLLLVKAKLEAIRLGLSTAPREFMADLVTEDGRTLEELLASGGLPQLLLGAGSPNGAKEKRK